MIKCQRIDAGIVKPFIAVKKNKNFHKNTIIYIVKKMKITYLRENSKVSINLFNVTARKVITRINLDSVRLIHADLC